MKGGKGAKGGVLSTGSNPGAALPLNDGEPTQNRAQAPRVSTPPAPQRLVVGATV